MFLKKMMVATTALVFLVGTLPVEASTFGKSSSRTSTSSFRSSSSSSSFSSSNTRRSTFGSSVSKSTATNSSGGISQGQSIGMSRSNIANNVKSGNYTAPANGTTVAGSNPGGSSYSNSGSYSNRNYGNSPGYYNNGAYNNGYQQNQGHSTGTVVGAAAAGALAGYALGSHNNGTTVVVPNNGYNNGYNNGAVYNNGNPVVVDNNGNYANAPVVMPAQASSGGFFSFIWTLLKIVIGLVVLFFIVRFVMSLLNRSGSNNGMGSGFSAMGNSTPVYNTKTPEDEIRDMKENFFVQFQENNRPSGLDHIRQNSTTMFYNAVKDMVSEQDESRSVTVRRVEAELVNLVQEGSRYIASVKYDAVVSEGTNGNMQDSEVKELWNFEYQNNRWRLAGIDQL